MRRLCDLIDPEHPDYKPKYRGTIVELAEQRRAGGTVFGQAVEHQQYPGLTTMAGNALAAAGRVVAAVVKGEAVMVPAEVFAERLAICRACPFNDSPPPEIHCTRCGCHTMKLTLATEWCPVGKWERWERPTS